jgi:hypothetical protein
MERARAFSISVERSLNDPKTKRIMVTIMIMTMMKNAWKCVLFRLVFSIVYNKQLKLCNFLSFWSEGNIWCNNFFPWRNSPSGLPDCWGFTITVRHTTLGRTPLDEWSASRKNLYLTTHNAHKRETSIRPEGFESTITASELPQTHAL